MKPSIALLFLALLPAVPAAGQVPDPGPVVHGDASTVRVRHAWAARFQEVREGPETTERFSKTVRVGPTGAFELSNVAGDIVVTGGSGSDVRIEAVKRVRHHDAAEAKRLLDALTIEVNELPSRVEVRTIYPRMSRMSGSVDYTITLPAGASAAIRSVSGDIRLSNVKGEVRIESVSGNVITRATPRLGQVKSVSGDVEVTDASSELGIVAQTVSGDLVLRGVKARDVDANTVSGDVTLSVDCERVRVRTVSGTVAFAGALSRGGRYEFNSHSGDLRITVADNTGFEVDANTFSGDLRSTVQLAGRTTMDDERRRGRRQTLRGTFGDGSALIVLRTFSGDVVVAKK